MNPMHTMRPAIISAIIAAVIGFASGIGVAVKFLDKPGDTPPPPAPVAVIAPKPPPLAMDQKKPSPVAKIVSTGNSGDRTTARIAQRERAKGNYLLDLDIPWTLQWLSDGSKKTVESIMQAMGPEYQKLFDQYGLDPATQGQLLHHLELIYKAKSEARRYMTNLVNAQEAFDSRMKKELGDRYSEFQDYEDMDAARRETSRLLEYSSKNGAPALSMERLAEVADIIQRTGSYSEATIGEWGGAMADMERPRGGRAVAPAWEKAKANLVANAAQAVALAKSQGFSESEIQSLQQYFNSQVKYYDDSLADLRDPVGARLRFLERQLTRMRQDPAATPADIQRTQTSLTNLRAAINNQPSGP
jgi:hypothetical protein